MGSHGRPRKKISKDYPQVAALAQCLRDLMDARGITNEELRAAVGVRGHGRLTCYLDGEEVPEEQLLRAFFIAPMETVRELDAEEARRLDERYRAAAEVKPPRKATAADRVPILENDLAAAKETILRVWQLAVQCVANGEQHMRAAKELREALGHLQTSLTAVTQQLREAEEAGRQSHAQAEMLKFQGTWFSQKLTERAMEIDSLHEHARVMESSLVEALQTISRQEETIQELEDNRLLYDRLSLHHRRTIAALESARADDDAKYRQAMDEWGQAVQDWEREKSALADGVAGLQREVARLKAANSQVGADFLERGKSARAGSGDGPAGS